MSHETHDAQVSVILFVNSVVQ